MVWSHLTERHFPRWLTRRPDSTGIAYDSGWSVRLFRRWPPVTAPLIASETGSMHEFRPMPTQYDELYKYFRPATPLAAEKMAKVYQPSPTGKWAHEYVSLQDIK